MSPPCTFSDQKLWSGRSLLLHAINNNHIEDILGADEDQPQVRIYTGDEDGGVLEGIPDDRQVTRSVITIWRRKKV